MCSTINGAARHSSFHLANLTVCCHVLAGVPRKENIGILLRFMSCDGDRPRQYSHNTEIYKEVLWEQKAWKRFLGNDSRRVLKVSLKEVHDM